MRAVKDGTILIDKPAGLSSFGVVARVRRVLSQAAGHKVKVGHTGTLDPFATGLMILVVGKECKNAQAYSKLDKEYVATIRLGQVSSTGDPEGQLSPAAAVVPSKAAVATALRRFTGRIEQTPPQFSAIKIDGQRAYKLARSGQTVEMPRRMVTIYELEMLDYAYPDLRVRARVSSGTYIRTLAEDIGRALGTGAYCHQLRRTQVADWSVDQAQILTAFGISD